jgi:hypothetical protein
MYANEQNRINQSIIHIMSMNEGEIRWMDSWFDWLIEKRRETTATTNFHTIMSADKNLFFVHCFGIFILFFFLQQPPIGNEWGCKRFKSNNDGISGSERPSNDRHCCTTGPGRLIYFLKPMLLVGKEIVDNYHFQKIYDGECAIVV